MMVWVKVVVCINSREWGCALLAGYREAAGGHALFFFFFLKKKKKFPDVQEEWFGWTRQGGIVKMGNPREEPDLEKVKGSVCFL